MLVICLKREGNTNEDKIKYIQRYRELLSKVPQSERSLVPEGTSGGDKNNPNKTRGFNWMADSYKRGATIMFLPAGDGTYKIIDPLEVNSQEKLFRVLNQNYQISQKTNPEKAGTKNKK